MIKFKNYFAGNKARRYMLYRIKLNRESRKNYKKMRLINMFLAYLSLPNADNLDFSKYLTKFYLNDIMKDKY